MRTTTISSIITLFFAATLSLASASADSQPGALERFAPAATFDVSSSASSLDLRIEIESGDASKLLKEASLQSWDGSLPEALIRWVVLPDHGNAEVHVSNVEATRSGESSNDLRSTRLSSSELSQFTSLGAPQTMRGIRMVPLAVRSMIVDSKGKTIVASRLDVQVEFTGGQGLNEVVHPSPVTEGFASLIRNMTLNPPAEFPHRDPAAAYSSRMLILRPSSLANQAALNSLSAFADWKRQQGFEVTLTSVNTANTTPVQIRDLISDGYPEDPYDYVLIVGWYYSYLDTLRPDATLEFPAFEVEDDESIRPGDLFYATLDNEGDETDDWLPDVMIGRMVAHSPADLQAVLNRSIRYERDPYSGPNGDGAWYHRAVHCEDGVDADSLLKDSDFEMARWVGNLLARKSMTTSVYMGGRNDTEADERTSLEEGVSIASADGYLFGMAVGTDEGDWDEANTGRMHPFVIANAHYYDYPRLFPFFSSGTLNDPNGPIGAVGFAFGHWDRISRPFVAGALRAIINGDDKTISNFWLGSALNVMGNLVTIHPDSSLAILELKQKLSQVIMLGDPTVNLFLDLPKTLATDLPETLYPGTTVLAFKLTDADNQPVSGATVAISQSNRIHLVAWTDESGNVAISIPNGIAEGNVQLTVSKQGYQPVFLANLPVEYPPVNLVLQNFTLDPDPLVNGTSSALGLTIENDGENDAEEVDVEFKSDSPFLTFSRNSAALDNIASGENGGLSSEVNLILSPSCPGGTIVQVLLNMSSRNDAWQAAFEFTTSGPHYDAPSVVVYENVRPGAEGTVSPRLVNSGDRAGIALNATLVSLTEHVRIVEGNRNYGAIATGDTGMPNSAFRVAVDTLFVPGQWAEFELRLTGEGNVATALRFRKVISQADVNDPIGPDNYGYYAFDSRDAGWAQAPTFDWIEINPDYEAGNDFDGVRLDLQDEGDRGGSSTLIDLPFSFRYYGKDYDQLVICSNGWVSFDTLSLDYHSPNNEGMPAIGPAPDAQLAVCWQDIFNFYPWKNGIYTHSDTENGIVVIEWSDLQLEQAQQVADSAQFQIILYDPAKYPTRTGDGEIKFQYRRFSEVSGKVDYHWYSTIGIRNPDGTDGIQYRHALGYNELANPVENGFAIMFTPSLSNTYGTVSGRFARLENQQLALPDVQIFSYRGIDVVSAQDGSFQFSARPGHYENVSATLRHFNDMTLTFDVREGEVTNLGNLLMVHPEISQVPERVTTGLQPGFPTQQPVFFNNSGNGQLDYTTSIVRADGQRATFEILDTFRIGTILGDNSTTSPVYVDQVLFFPRNNGGNGAQVMTAVGLNGARTGEEVPLPGRDSLDAIPQSVTSDGADFWGSFRYLDSPVNDIIEFNRQGAIQRRFISPFNSQTINAIITYSPARNSLFAIQPEDELIVELGLDSAHFGEIINSWEVSFPTEELIPTGIGWNSYDTDNMPLYLILKNWATLPDGVRGQRIVRFDPESGNFEIFTYIRNINLPTVDGVDRSSFGLAFIPGHKGANVAMVLNENVNPVRNDILKIVEIGPYVPFVSGRLIHTPGSVPAGGQGFFTIPFDATGLEESDYSFGVKLFHNALGDSVFIPITLNVNDTNGVGDDPVTLPIDFGITRLYPNPFNSRIGIDFVMPIGERSVLKVFDLAGREVATLFDGRSVSGSERLFWDAANFSTGVYIVRLESGDRVVTRKAALIK